MGSIWKEGDGAACEADREGDGVGGVGGEGDVGGGAVECGRGAGEADGVGDINGCGRGGGGGGGGGSDVTSVIVKSYWL